MRKIHNNQHHVQVSKILDQICSNNKLSWIQTWIYMKIVTLIASLFKIIDLEINNSK